MLKFLKKEANITYTENGALSYETTSSDCLDLFATAGALRSRTEEEIVGRFARAYIENADLAMKILFFTRDIRGGLGERRTFRVILRWLSGFHKDSVRKNLAFIAEYGRFDDMLCLLDTPCKSEVLAYLKKQVELDLAAAAAGKPVSLLAKWLPSINTSSPVSRNYAARIARGFQMNQAQYRKTLSLLRRRIHIVENDLREKQYTFDYAKLPSKALLKYRAAFYRNDPARYEAFLEQAEAGTVKMNTGTLTPYDIITPFFTRQTGDSERRSLDTAWKGLADFTNGENALVVVDGSASMYQNRRPLPAAVAISLALYFAERNNGVFKNHFITFSHNPRLVEIKGRTLYEKVAFCAQYNEVADTNIQKVFELILRTAVKHKLPQKKLPATIYIISDMEFNICAEDAELTNFAWAKEHFAKHGYALPSIVFWNVDSRGRQQPVHANEQGVTLVSGCSPRLFSSVLSGNLSPYGQMLEILNSGRYDEIRA